MNRQRSHVSPSTLLTVNLGCGDDPRPGMLNVDRYNDGARERMDALDLKLADTSVGRLEALHLVEHLGWTGCTFAFCEWFRVMAPGATLVIETPDLLETARQFAAADYPHRAVLASWIYGLESPGMKHAFGFEFRALKSLLLSCGFERVRRHPARSHPPLPGMRITAQRGDDPAQVVHAAFKRSVLARGAAPLHQPIAVELHHTIAQDIVEVFRRAGPRTEPVNELLARVTAHDPDIARAALDACAPMISPRAGARWTRALAYPRVQAGPAIQTAALLSLPRAPGRMGATWMNVRNRFQTWVRDRATGKHTTPCAFRVAATNLQVRPFSVAGLSLESQRQLSLGLHCFAEGELPRAEYHFLLSATFNSNLPVAFWNLARVCLARERRDQALAWLNDAELAATHAASPSLPLITRERQRVATGKSVKPAPISPASLMQRLP